MAEWRARNPEKVKVANASRGWTEKDKATKRARYQRDPLKGRMYQKTYRYGISALDLYTLRKQQGDLCAICGKPQEPVKRRRGIAWDLSIDHDHETGAVRGLLCFKCNAALGALGDNLDGLKRAISYLEKHPDDP